MRTAGIVVIACAMCVCLVRAGNPLPEPARQFLSRPAEPGPTTVAIRRLEATNTRLGKHGWMVVRVTAEPERGQLSWTVLEEGGSQYVRDKVLKEALEREAAVLKEGLPSVSGLDERNYRFDVVTGADQAAVPGGLARFRILPKRKDTLLIDGTVWVASADADLVQIDGRLSKSPSFWTKTVDVIRRYARIDGVRVPVLMESTADVRIVGRSSFKMTYEYEQINGRTPGSR